MSTPMPHRIRPAVLVLVAALLFAGSVTADGSADSAADLLEKGLYKEQTVGDLSGAIALYTRVLDAAAADRPHLAEAQLRLGVCHLKQGDGAAARAAFDSLIRDYPEQEALVARARGRLADLMPEVDLLPIPWTDGEVLEYRVSLPTGRVVGSVFLTADATTVDGADAWRLSLYRV
ncbi:MAG: tetratricopeptide repeat protein, partial [Acidobacteriota bacterium]